MHARPPTRQPRQATTPTPQPKHTHGSSGSTNTGCGSSGVEQRAAVGKKWQSRDNWQWDDKQCYSTFRVNGSCDTASISGRASSAVTLHHAQPIRKRDRERCKSAHVQLPFTQTPRTPSHSRFPANSAYTNCCASWVS